MTQFIQLKRPVLYSERFTFIQRYELPQWISALHNSNCTLVQAIAHFCCTPALTGVDHTKTWNKNYSRQYFHYFIFFTVVPFEVFDIFLFILLNTILNHFF